VTARPEPGAAGATLPGVASERLAARLGLGIDARALIVSCAGLGTCHAANHGIYEALRRGAASGAELVVPAPWAREAVSRYLGEDIGVELTLNAEHDHYRWGPLTQAPSLLDGDGGLPRTPADTWDHADLEEVRRECRAQVERAIWWGLDVTHLTSHLDTLVLRPEFFDVYLELALDFDLPVRIADGSHPDRLGFPAREVAQDAGVVFVDRVLSARRLGARVAIATRLASLEPGVTELRLHPAIDTPELRALASDWETRVDDHRLVCADSTLAEALDAAGVKLLGYRALRDLVRSGRG
jgi:predicted glycoside hydrolase/deacetylase ChbG (UPF0249 family)